MRAAGFIPAMHRKPLPYKNLEPPRASCPRRLYLVVATEWSAAFYRRMKSPADGRHQALTTRAAYFFFEAFLAAFFLAAFFGAFLAAFFLATVVPPYKKVGQAPSRIP
jgi:hypothetical protein